MELFKNRSAKLRKKNPITKASAKETKSHGKENSRTERGKSAKKAGNKKAREKSGKKVGVLTKKPAKGRIKKGVLAKVIKRSNKKKVIKKKSAKSKSVGHRAPRRKKVKEKVKIQKTFKKIAIKEKEMEKAALEIQRESTSSVQEQKKERRRETAQTLALKQREISIAEFFTKNRHLLGFDNPQKALLTTVKEAVDNSLDACEDAALLPTIKVTIEELSPDRYKITVEDNGPGIVKSQIPKIFARLLYGSKFHTLKQSRGQQGMGISAAGMYGQLTTGKPVRITSRISRKKRAHYYELMIDTSKNKPNILCDEKALWDVDHGTKVELEIEAVYKKGRRSVDDYIQQTVLANPHAELFYSSPKDGEIHYPRITEILPKDAIEIKPHPYGVELGLLINMLKDSQARNIKSMLMNDFSRVSPRVAIEILEKAEIDPSTKPRDLTNGDSEKIFRAIQEVKIMSPPANCISPIGEDLLFKGLRERVQADFYASCTRPPSVYRGNPFQIEVGLAYGGELSAENPAEILRFANRVPLLYQQSACAITKSILSTDWRKYGLQQPRGSLPLGPIILLVYIASVWVPFTSESKEAIAHYPEIIKEVKLALQECGRRLSSHIRRHKKAEEEHKKRSYIEQYIPHIGEALQDILKLKDRQKEKVISNLKEILQRSRKM
jgi:DNA topoisomerase-6 subunit B